jgi:hypothetical protein
MHLCQSEVGLTLPESCSDVAGETVSRCSIFFQGAMVWQQRADSARLTKEKQQCPGDSYVTVPAWTATSMAAAARIALITAIVGDDITQRTLCKLSL